MQAVLTKQMEKCLIQSLWSILDLIASHDLQEGGATPESFPRGYLKGTLYSIPSDVFSGLSLFLFKNFFVAILLLKKLFLSEIGKIENCQKSIDNYWI